jgi:hypothetical protein
MKRAAPTITISGINLSWQIFYHSRFRHWPARTKFKTNKAQWAKQ